MFASWISSVGMFRFVEISRKMGAFPGMDGVDTIKQLVVFRWEWNEWVSRKGVKGKGGEYTSCLKP